jgi:hypothetical protein
MVPYRLKFSAKQLKGPETRMKLLSVMMALEKVAFALLTIINSFSLNKKEKHY